MTDKDSSNLNEVDTSAESIAPSSAGFMKYYGIYWRKEFIFDGSDERILAGLPNGWIGSGNIAKTFDRSAMWANFWDQKGVYVLYDKDLTPVYTGQAGLIRSKKKSDSSGRTLGERLGAHRRGKYRNGWEFFSWFGFLDATNVSEIKNNIRKDDEEAVNLKRNPVWSFSPNEKNSEVKLNDLLDSFEAILIEAFTPKFNARGGNLKGAVYVNQLEEKPFFMKQA